MAFGVIKSIEVVKSCALVACVCYYCGVVRVVMYEYIVHTYAYVAGTYQDDRIPKAVQNRCTKIGRCNRPPGLTH